MAENAGLDRNQAGEDFKNILKDLAEDLNFLNAGTDNVILQIEFYIFLTELIRSNDVYSEKLHSNKYNDKDLINLSWKLKELGDLNEMGRNCIQILMYCLQRLANTSTHGNKIISLAS